MRPVPGPVEGGLGFGIGYRTIVSKAETRKPFSLIERLSDLQSNGFAFCKFLKLDCHFFPGLGQFQECSFQLWSPSGHASSASCTARLRHSFGSPGMTSAPGINWSIPSPSPTNGPTRSERVIG
jgi:hypothetical protein